MAAAEPLLAGNRVPTLPNSGMHAANTTSDSREFMVRPGTLDAAIVDWVHRGNEYRLPGRFPDHTVVIDVGAHIGAFTLAAVDRGAQHVLAVEAIAENRVLAVMNMREELATGQVELTLAAVTGPHRAAVTMGPAPYHEEQLNTGGHRIADADADAAATTPGTVPAITLDALIGRARSLLADAPTSHLWVKLDCEGSEWEILGTSATLRCVDVMVGEYHEAADESFGPQLPCNADGLTSHLASAGFSTRVTPDRVTPGLGLFWAWRE